MTTETRKKRSDRNYVLYRIEVNGSSDFYIGLTVSRGRAFLASVKTRLQKHFSRAKQEDKQWSFCNFIRNNPEATYTYQVIEVVRGRTAAYSRERELIREFQPNLNTF